MTTYLAHTILNVSDWEKSLEFYTKLMNALDVPSRVVCDTEEWKITAFQIEGAPIYIRWARDEEKKSFVRNVGLDHIALGVEEKEKVDEVFKLVSESGMVVTSAPKTYPDYTDNYYAFYFRDPDGIPFEVAFI